jgi:hypothetical protein
MGLSPKDLNIKWLPYRSYNSSGKPSGSGRKVKRFACCFVYADGFGWYHIIFVDMETPLPRYYPPQKPGALSLMLPGAMALRAGWGTRTILSGIGRLLPRSSLYEPLLRDTFPARY